MSNKAKPFVKLGDKADGMFILFSGNAEVIIPGKLSAGKTEEEKKEGLQEGEGSVVAVIPEGVAFGHLGLLTPGGRRNATVGTRSGHTEALFLDRESYLNLVYQNDVKASQLIQECVKKSGICEALGWDIEAVKEFSRVLFPHKLTPNEIVTPVDVQTGQCHMMFIARGQVRCDHLTGRQHSKMLEQGSIIFKDAALPRVPSSSVTSTSTVGLPRLSRISRAKISSIMLILGPLLGR